MSRPSGGGACRQSGGGARAPVSWLPRLWCALLSGALVAGRAQEGVAAATDCQVGAWAPPGGPFHATADGACVVADYTHRVADAPSLAHCEAVCAADVPSCAGFVWLPFPYAGSAAGRGMCRYFAAACLQAWKLEPGFSTVMYTR